MESWGVNREGSLWGSSSPGLSCAWKYSCLFLAHPVWKSVVHMKVEIIKTFSGRERHTPAKSYLCAFIYIILLRILQKTHEVCLVISTKSWINWGSKSLSKYPKVEQLGSGETHLWLPSVVPKMHNFYTPSHFIKDAVTHLRRAAKRWPCTQTFSTTVITFYHSDSCIHFLH